MSDQYILNFSFLHENYMRMSNGHTIFHVNYPKVEMQAFGSFFFFILISKHVFLFPTVVDTNDRFLRKITVGQANTEKGHARQVRASYF